MVLPAVIGRDHDRFPARPISHGADAFLQLGSRIADHIHRNAIILQNEYDKLAFGTTCRQLPVLRAGRKALPLALSGIFDQGY